MINNIGWLIFGVSVSLAGCVLNPVVSQLDQFQKWQAADQPGKIIAEPVTAACKSSKEGCARLYALHAEALTTISMQKRSAGAVCPASAESKNLKLAAADYVNYFEHAAAGDHSVAAKAEQTLCSNYVLTLYCVAESADSVSAGLEWAKSVDEAAKKLEVPESLLWRSRANLYLARPGAGDFAARCSAVKQAREFAAQGAAAGADEHSKEIFDRLISDADQLRRQINACGG